MNDTQTSDKSFAALSEKGSQLKQHVGEMASIATGMAGEKIGELKRGAAALGRAGIDKASEFQDGAAEYVRNRPMASIAMAVGIGALVGFMMTRRR